jgi:acetoacetyl-CoA synthetase
MVFSIRLIRFIFAPLGREGQASDTLTGVRFGSAEIYNCLMVFTEIEESLCLGQRRPHDSDEQVLLFVKMKQGYSLDRKLKAAIEARIGKDLSPRHVPKFIFETPEIPMTVNGKKTELPVKKIVSGQKITPSTTIINSGSLKWYEQSVYLDDRGSTNYLANFNSSK